jgi:hypothetical protein
MQQTDVLNASLSSSGVLFSARQRIRQIVFVGNGTTNGAITIYDNPTTNSGRIVWSISLHTSNVPVSIDIPGEGILCVNGAYAVMTNITGMSICYG